MSIGADTREASTGRAPTPLYGGPRPRLPLLSGRAWQAWEFVRGWIGLGVPVEVPAEPADQAGLGWLAPAAVTMCASLLLVAISLTLARTGEEWLSPLLYWIGATGVFLPGAVRVAGPDASRRERLLLVSLTGLAIYAIKVLHAPLGFIHFDEFLHAVTVNGIVETGYLFSGNALLPISAVYPAMEIVTSAIVDLTGLSVFASAVLLMAASRFLFIASLYLLVERMTTSSRIAAVACMVFLGNSNIAVFYAQYAYESMAVVLLVQMMLADYYDLTREDRSIVRTAGLVLPFLLALAATHHMTSTVAAALLVVVAVLECTRPVDAYLKMRAVALAAFAVVVVAVWTQVIGSPTSSYIGPRIEQGLHELYLLATGQAPARRLFVSDDGVKQAMLRQVISIAAMLIVLGGLATGFLRSLSLTGAGGRPGTLPAMLMDLWRWKDSRLVCLVMLTFAFPVGLAFRLTTGGWEIGARLGSLSFFGVCLVVAVALCCCWQGRGDSVGRVVTSGVVLTTLYLGGLIIGWGPANLLTGYKVAADSMSIEPMGMDAARWTREQLGEGRRFAADRTNRLLLATYGHQRVITTLEDRIDVSEAVMGKTLGPEQVNDLKAARVDYVLVDLRLSTGLPVMGVYFEKGEPVAIHETAPEPASLLKFNALPGVSRPYDNGAIVLFDVGALRDGG